MKIVATSDTHFPITKEVADALLPAGDVLVIAGDLMYAGMPHEWYPLVDALAALDYKHKLFVPGNHDLFFQMFAGPCMQDMRKAGVHCLTPTKPTVEIDGVRFAGCPFVTNLPNWAYNSDEDSIWGYLDSLRRTDVLICHSPPAGVLDSDGKGRYGVGAIRKYMSHYEPGAVVCGHVHEAYGMRKVGRTMVYNASMCDADYKQVNPAHVIEA